MKRYEMVLRHEGDGGVWVDPIEDHEGEWVRREDVEDALALADAVRRVVWRTSIKEIDDDWDTRWRDAPAKRG